MDEDRTTSEVRHGVLIGRAELIEHLKAIGNRIILDAEQIAPDTRLCQSIGINAYISCDEQTTIEYTITMIADPRFRKGED